MKRWTGRPRPLSGLTRGIGLAVFAGYGLAAALVGASSWFDWHGPYATRPVIGVVTVIGLVFASGCAGRAARHAQGRRSAGWLAMSVALAGWAVGEVIWSVYDVRPELDHASHPASAEIVLLLYPLGAFTSLLLLSGPVGHNFRRLFLDGVIVATSLFVASWVFVLDRLLREASASGPTTLVHIFADVVLMTTAILALSRGRPGGQLSVNLVAGAVVTIGVADILVVFQTGVGSYHTGELVDVSRVAGLGMLALAGLISVNETPTASTQETSSRLRLWLPYIPVLLAAAVGLGHALRLMRHGPLLIGAGILVAAVLARQFVVLVENQGLLAEVAREAFRDSLTGLANRANFLHQLEQAVARRGADAAPIAVMCLDLDNFKSVNDALGHPAGDELLVRVAGRLTTALGEVGTVARLGGDEFAVLIEGPVEDAEAAAQRVLGSFETPIVIDGVPLAVRPSIGFTVATAESSCTVDELLRHADLAMYAAKREGGQCIRSFVPDLPLPYALPELAGSADFKSNLENEFDSGRIHRGAFGAATSSANITALARTIRPPAPAPRHSPDQPPNVRWPPVWVRISLVCLAIGVIVFAQSCLPDPRADHSPFFADVLYPGLNLFAAALIAIRAYRVKADRAAWTVIAIGMVCSALGDVLYVRFVPDGQSPSIADPAYLAFYPLAYIGLLLLMRTRLKRVPVPVRLDSVVCGLAMAAVAAALAAGPIHAATVRAPATVLVGLVYPWGDLVLTALAAGMIPILGWRREFRWGLLVAGFLMIAAADTAYLFETSASDYRVGTMLDAFWPTSSLLLAMASWAPWSSAPPLPRRGLGSYVTPVTCTVVALAVTAVGRHSAIAPTLAALSLVAVAARFSVTFRDVSILAETHKQAMTDELTTLPNRRSLATALTEVPVDAPASPLVGPAVSRAPARRALLLLQLYEFDEINDSVGYHFGDELLCQIANRLSHNVRRDDLLARAGDDEFAVLLAEGADLIAARAQAGRLLEALNEPFALDPMTVQVDGRIAIALYPDHCDHPQELLTRAEMALPHARSAKSKIAVYDSAFELYRDNDPNLIEELRAALVDGTELTCHYQPKINAADGSVHSVEALLRWHHPSRGLLLPEEFLPAAERAGLMRKVANRTVNLALEQARSWREQGMPLTVAVNLSTTNLLDLDLVSTIEQLLQTHGLPADELIIEITESTLVDSARSRSTVAALQRLGVRISLDDYGTGWSSLARLQDVSVDELKLDRIFVARLAQDPRSVAIVRSTVALAASLGADLVAEGVEDESTLRALRQYGCTITQGFVHSPPLPAEELQRWISTHAPAVTRTD
ncbi:bifunctional diguanylate cyclase/phosphodiesterase [Mycobacterium asiaticum]|uniref:bifunctional diguanylate cyclase/phosphodiesterase n=1 Tax=Mycobacterium asiaticum TaxID=1790 RepID=UPI0009B8B61F|nr:bifunctional diguanylate cyclase/phosphodiesterase [Mycobacterium asiaticum]ORA09530.1 GGDEF-domain containing protein [Mycobacterium asiaticum DSM 44297]